MVQTGILETEGSEERNRKRKMSFMWGGRKWMTHFSEMQKRQKIKREQIFNKNDYK